MYLGRVHKTALTPPTHELVDHTISPLDLLDLLGHDGIDHTMSPHDLLDLLGHDGIDHTMSPHDLLDALTHNMLSHVGRTGVGDLHTAAGGPSGTTRHDTLNHAGLPGISSVMQSAHFGGASVTSISTGALGFTPIFAIMVGVDLTQSSFIHTTAIFIGTGAAQQSHNNSNGLVGVTGLIGNQVASGWTCNGFSAGGITTTAGNTHNVALVVVGQ